MKHIDTILVRILLGLILLGSVSLSAQTPVATFLDLWKVRDNLSGTYIQTADIDLDLYAPQYDAEIFYEKGDLVTDTEGFIYHCVQAINGEAIAPGNTSYWMKLWEAEKGWDPIGDEDEPFTGIYNGDGHTIKNLYINRGANASADNDSLSGGENHIGLFGHVRQGSNANAVIKNLGIQNPRVRGRKNTAALVGRAESTNKDRTVHIMNCYVQGDIDSYVKGFGSTGGLVGAAISRHAVHGPIEIRNSWTDVNVSSTHPSNVNQNIRYGGLVGYMKRSIAYDCFAYNEVVGGDQVGGIVGFLDNAGVTRCYFSGSVTQNYQSDNPGIGAIVGNYNGNFPNSLADTTGGNSAPNCYYPADNPPEINPIGGGSANNQGAPIDFSAPENFDDDWDFSDVWNFNDGLPILEDTPAQELPDYYYYTVEDGDWDDDIWYKTTNPGFVGGFSSNPPQIDYTLGIMIGSDVTLNQNLEIGNLVIGANSGLTVAQGTTLAITSGGADHNLLIKDEGSLNIDGTVDLGDNTTMVVSDKGKVHVDPESGGINPGQSSNLIVNSEDFDYSNVGVDGLETLYLSFPPTNRMLHPFSATTVVDDELWPHYIERKWQIMGVAQQANTSKMITLYWNAADDDHFDWSQHGAQPVVYKGDTPITLTAYNVNTPRRWVRFNWEFPVDGDSAKDSFQIGVRSEDDSLPVELSSFTASVHQGRSIQLIWQTQSETNVQGFSFYRGQSEILADAVYLNVVIPATNSSQPKNYMYHDRDVFEPGLYFYWLESTDYDGSSQIFGPINIHFDGNNGGSAHVVPIPGFRDAYPNPFNPETTIRYGVDKAGKVEIKIYNQRGQLVRNLLKEDKAEGWHQVKWDGRSDKGQILSSGVYFALMRHGGKRYNYRIVMMK